MANKSIKIVKKGEDGYKVISVRIKETTLEKIDNLRSERSSAVKEKQDLEKRRSTINTITANFNTLLSNDAHFMNTSEHRQAEHDL